MHNEVASSVLKLAQDYTQLKFFPLINVKMPTTFISGKISILGLSEPEKS